MQRVSWFLFAVLTALFSLPGLLEAGSCNVTHWSLSAIASAPVLVAGRVLALDPPVSPVNQKRFGHLLKRTAEIEVLRSTQPLPPGPLKIRFLSRDGPDLSHCRLGLPELLPGQVLLLPLRANTKPDLEPWQFIGVEGYSMTTLVAADMRESMPAGADSRAFIIRELVNSFHGDDPRALFAAASLLASQGPYLEPELSAQLARQQGCGDACWAQILSSLLLALPGQPLSLVALQTREPQQYWTQFQDAFRLAQHALTELPGRAAAETLVWQSLLANLSGLVDEPQPSLWFYSRSFALRAAVRYLVRYRDDPAFIEAVKMALRQDRPGSSALAGVLLEKGQEDFLPEALARAMQVLRRPASDESDLSAALLAVLRFGDGRQRNELASIAAGFKKTNPEYADFLRGHTTSAGWWER
jgi:hypothetical protein